MSIQPHTFDEILRRHAQAQPERVAYTFLNDGEGEVPEPIAYAELDQRARAVGARLQTMARHGDRALLLLPPGLDYVVAFMACLYAGMTAVPAYPPRNARNLPRVRAIVQDSHAVVVLTVAAEEARLRALTAEIEDMPPLRWISVDAVPTDEHALWRPSGSDGETLAFLQYTSGSTGVPKGVMVSHANLLDNSERIRQLFQLQDTSVCVSWLPPYHDMGLIGGILQPLYVGISCHLMSPAAFLQRPVRWFEMISRERATHSGGPDFAFDLCARRISPEQCEGLDLSSWHVAYNGAEPVRAGTLDRFVAAFGGSGFRREFFLPCYGLAEATLLVTGTPGVVTHVVDPAAQEQGRLEASTADNARTLVACGPMDDSVAVVDTATSQPCAEGTIGEIWVNNGGVARGYWQRPEESAAAFGAHTADGRGPWMRTGDLGAVYDGRLYVTGRIKDLVILAGRNLYPTDIEGVVQTCGDELRPGFGVAFSIEHEGQERLVVLQELDFRRRVDAQEMSQRIAGRVAAVFEAVPYSVRLLKTGSLPVTSSGKLRRRDARAMYLAGAFDDAPGLVPTPTAAAQPAGSVADWLIQRIAARLRTAPASIDLDRPFVEFGLGSVEAVEMSAALEAWLGSPLPPTLLWDYPNIRLLVQHLQPGDALESSAPRAVAQGDRIAIVGMACRFPGAAEKGAFWKMLREGVDAISEVPPQRWDAAALYAEEPGVRGKACTRWGGFVDDVERFDAAFFGIAEAEAREMDPQQRMLLQAAWHALEDAAIPADTLAGSATGVYIGIGSNDFGRQLHGKLDALTALSGTGNALSIAANRISYQLGLLGPSMAVDTACSASLVSVHLACQALRTGEVDLALAGGVNVMLDPDMSVIFSQAGMMAADGRCKTFDARADGYVRGEGCGLVVLKRLSDALQDGDPIQAVIGGSAVNQSGRSNGLTAPSRVAQIAVVRRALAQAGIAPAQLGYIEAHGTGTALGDPIEIQGLAEVLGSDPRSEPCAVGSVKTNIGHLEAAAGIAGLIKTALMVRHGEIVPHLHLQTLNPRLRKSGLPLAVPTACGPWPSSGAFGRVAGVSSFGFGGSNAHVVLHEASAGETSVGEAAARSGGPHLLVLSARNEVALRILAAQWREALRPLDKADIADACRVSRIGRSALPERLAVWGDDAAALQTALAGFLQGDPALSWCSGTVSLQSTADETGASQAPPADLAASTDALAALAQTAHRWVGGAGVDWYALDRRRVRRGMEMPLYPFQDI